MPSIGATATSGGPGISHWYIAPMFAATRVACFVSLPRRYSTCTVSSGSRLRASPTSFLPGPDSSSSSGFTAASEVPLNFVMMSRTLRPAVSAGPPGVTPSILAPTLSVSGLASVLTTTPIRPRWSLSMNARTRGSRGGRGGRGVPCAVSPAGHAASATATMIQFRCMCDNLQGLKPHVSGASDVDAHELLHEVHALLPQCDEIGRTRLGSNGAQLCQLAVDDGNTVFQDGRERRGATARHPGVRVVALELLLQRGRLLLHARQLGGVDGFAPERPEHEEPGEGRSRREARDAPPLAAPAPLGQNGLTHRGPPVPRGPPGRQRLQLRDPLVQRLELRPALRARRRVLPGPRGPFPRSQCQQVVHGAVHHRETPSSSIRRNRTCARANCDLEKLTVLPICSAISSWV